MKRPARKAICKCGKEFTRYNSIQSKCPTCESKATNLKRSATRMDSTTTKDKKSFKSKIRKPTGEAEIFRQIWNDRPHICTNCKCWLSEPPRTYYFAHIIRKGKDEGQRLNPENILLHCLDCHTALDQGTKEQYENRKREIVM